MSDHACSSCNGCRPRIGRREFLIGSAAAAVALRLRALDLALCAPAAQTGPASQPAPAGGPLVHVVFVRPKKTPVVSWPGGQTDVDAQQALFARTIVDAAAKLGVRLELRDEPLDGKGQIDAYLEQYRKKPGDGLLICAMELFRWGDVHHLAQNRGEVPCVVYSHLTSFTGGSGATSLGATRLLARTFVGATHDVGWLAFGLRMLWANWQMKNTRLAILRGKETKEAVVKGLGVTLRYLPASRFDEELRNVEITDDVRAMARDYSQAAKEIVEPKPEEVLDAARNYVACKRILAAEGCQGLSYACLGRRNPVCMAFSRLLDEGIVAGCEADVDAAISLRLTHLLFNRPGFIVDPSANTVSNTFIGSHCTSATKLEGIDRPYRAAFKLRSYHTRTGASMQVLWPEGREVTVMKFQGPDRMILGSGKVISNIAQPPSGCCRTAVEIALDDVEDTEGCKGFHQLFILGRLERDFRAYCQLAGIEPVHI